LYFKVANNTLKENKPAPGIIQAAKKAAAAAKKYGNTSIKENAQTCQMAALAMEPMPLSI
jgi:hypothetical protein